MPETSDVKQFAPVFGIGLAVYHQSAFPEVLGPLEELLHDVGVFLLVVEEFVDAEQVEIDVVFDLGLVLVFVLLLQPIELPV